MRGRLALLTGALLQHRTTSIHQVACTRRRCCHRNQKGVRRRRVIRIVKAMAMGVHREVGWPSEISLGPVRLTMLQVEDPAPTATCSTPSTRRCETASISRGRQHSLCRSFATTNLLAILPPTRTVSTERQHFCRLRSVTMATVTNRLGLCPNFRTIPKVLLSIPSLPIVHH